MLPTSSPAAYIAAEKLAESAKCPDCGAKSILAAGVLHLGHYDFNGEPRGAHLDVFRQMLPLVGASAVHGPRVVSDFRSSVSA